MRPRTTVVSFGPWGPWWAALALVVVAVTAPALRDPPFWDANVYVNQGRDIAAHGLDFAHYRYPDVFKPPVFASAVLGGLSKLTQRAGRAAPGDAAVRVGRAVGAAPAGARARRQRTGGADRRRAVCDGAAVRRTGGPGAERSADDGVRRLAWVMLLEGRLVGWFVLAALAVLTKESAYFLCVPALALVWLRNQRSLAATARRILCRPGRGWCWWAGSRRCTLLNGQALPAANRDALRPYYVSMRSFTSSSRETATAGGAGGAGAAAPGRRRARPNGARGHRRRRRCAARSASSRRCRATCFPACRG